MRTAAGKELVPATCKSGDLALRGGRAGEVRVLVPFLYCCVAEGIGLGCAYILGVDL